MKTAEFYIKRLNLTQHPEGGYFKEVYRDDEIINKKHLHERYTTDHSFSTSIYNLHKIKSDETWHFYDGTTLIINIIDKDGRLSSVKLGRNIDEGEVFQFTIKKDSWFCAEVRDKNSFSLVGCTVSPGFDFSDFELGKRETLLKSFPYHKELITRFTRG